MSETRSTSSVLSLGAARQEKYNLAMYGAWIPIRDYCAIASCALAVSHLRCQRPPDSTFLAPAPTRQSLLLDGSDYGAERVVLDDRFPADNSVGTSTVSSNQKADIVNPSFTFRSTAIHTVDCFVSFRGGFNTL